MHICELAPILIQAIEVFQKTGKAPSLQKNQADFFGKNDHNRKGNFSMSKHIYETTNKRVSGSTLLQSMYKPVCEFLEGRGSVTTLNPRPDTISTLKEYIRKDKGLITPGIIKEEEPVYKKFDGGFPVEIEAYKNTTWYVYSYEEYPARRKVSDGKDKSFMIRGIGRAVLKILDSGEVEITNFNTASGQRILNTNYFGRLALRDRYVLEFDLFSENGEDKHLHMRMLRAHVPIQDLALGGYINKGVKYGLLMGALVYELVTDQTSEVEPHFFQAKSPDFFQLDKSIVRYLRKRQYNYLRVTGQIPDSTELLRWLETSKAETLSYPDRYEDHIKDVFVAAPISSLEEGKRNELKAGLLKIEDALKAHHGFSYINSGITEQNNPDRFWQRDVLRNQDLIEKMKSSRYFVLIYPEPVVSSSLIQAGFSLGLKKPVIIFYRNKYDLPMILQKSSDVRSFGSIKLFPFETFEDIVTIIKNEENLFLWLE